MHSNNISPHWHRSASHKIKLYMILYGSTYMIVIRGKTYFCWLFLFIMSFYLLKYLCGAIKLHCNRCNRWVTSEKRCLLFRFVLQFSVTKNQLPFICSVHNIHSQLNNDNPVEIALNPIIEYKFLINEIQTFFVKLITIFFLYSSLKYNNFYFHHLQ